MAQLAEIVQHLDTFLKTQHFKDHSLNGLQVESSKKEIRRVAYAVDTGESIVARSIDGGAQLLITHHGLFWGQEYRVTGVLGRKIERLLTHGCSLYVSHLPLDGHLEAGNNALLAKFFECGPIEPFFLVEGSSIGVKSSLAAARPREWFEAKASALIPQEGTLSRARYPLLFPFGPPTISNIGFVSGAGSSALTAAISENLDLLITGEPKQESYHLAKELKMNILFAGHYYTERFGVQALANRLSDKFGVSTFAVEEDTGI